VALPDRDHTISLQDAAALTKRHRNTSIDGIQAGAFHKDQVVKLLNQTGCVGLRIYFGRDATGAPTLVLAGIDGMDADLTGSQLLEWAFPCPPYCGPANSLNS
jgi:hypothetical protein